MGEWWGKEDLVSQRPLWLRDEDHRPLLQAPSSTVGHAPGNSWSLLEQSRTQAEGAWMLGPETVPAKWGLCTEEGNGH